jgi:hypothetical protein
MYIYRLNLYYIYIQKIKYDRKKKKFFFLVYTLILKKEKKYIFLIELNIHSMRTLCFKII